MASVSSLSAPGVEVREYDQSLRITSNTGTTVFVPGYAPQGPVEEVLSVSSIADFENIYGIPTNAAERYFYYTVLAILNNSGLGTTVLTSRLPYGAGEGDNVANAYNMLVYPAVPVKKNAANTKGYDHYSVALSSKDANANDPNGEFSRCKNIFNIVKDTEEYNLNSIDFTFIPNSNKQTVISDIKITGATFATTDTSKIILTLSITEEEKETVVSAEATYQAATNDNGMFVINMVSLIKVDESPIGNITCNLIYDKIEESGEIKFKNEGEAISLGTLIPAYEIIEKYSTGANDEDVTYLIGAPATYNVSLEDYYTIITGEYFKWENAPHNFGEETTFGGDMKKALGNAAFITINTSRSIINENYEGLYLGLTDNIFNEPNDDYIFNSINDIRFTNWYRNTSGEIGETTVNGIIDNRNDLNNEFISIPKSQLDFLLDSSNKGSISYVLQTGTTSFDTSSAEYDDTVNLGLFKLARTSTGSGTMKLTYSIAEQYNASFGQKRTYSTSTTMSPQNYFIESIIESSKNITIMVNPYISKNIKTDINGDLHGKIRFLSDKLVENYKHSEAKYLNKGVSAEVAENTEAKVLINYAHNNIANWAGISKRIGASLVILNKISNAFNNDEYTVFSPINSLYQFGTYTPNLKSNKIIGNTPAKIKRALELVSNDEEYPDIDIVVEGGLGTVYAYSNATEFLSDGASSILSGEGGDIMVDEDSNKDNTFNEDAILTGIEDLRTSRSTITEDAQAVVEDYIDVQNAFLTIANSFQNGGRGDTFYVADILRGILIRGANTKVEKIYGTKMVSNAYGEAGNVKHSWSTSIYSPIKHIVEPFTSSYASVYAQWVKISDAFTNEKYWVPVSGYMTALMCAADQLQGPWYAAAGLNRGIVNGVIDCAINPNQKQRGDLYKLCVNSVPKLANIGITNWGIRTLSKKASAFDQNTCRRTFLFIEKAIKKLLRYYLFEPNNAFTQLSIYNEIYPYMESIRNQGGVYAFSVVCDKTNNTDEIVNSGNLAVDVSAAPTRTAEFIVLNMTANKYSSEVSTNEFNS